MLKRLLRRPAARALLVALLGRYLQFALRTTRWTLHGAEHLAPHAAGSPADDARAHVLVSRHRDGRVIGEVLRRFGVEVVHGSTSRDGQDRGGASSVRALLDVVAGGGHVVITPDGPRGPRRQAALGVAQLAALSGVPVLPCAAQMRPCWILSSWDRMMLPLPWGRGTIVCGPAIAVPREDWEAWLPVIAQAMTDATGRASEMCR
jgi:lysophospholipid acyltransferase (LPLAT)-like uncharacterized protein